MNKLIALELKRNSLRPYHIAVLIITVTMMAFLYLLAGIAKIDPAEASIEMLSSYNSLIGLNHIICMAVFVILSAVMSARFIVEEYSGKKAVLLFSYPIPRRKVLGTKLVLVFFYTTISMFLSGAFIQLIFFTTEAVFPLCTDTLTVKIVITAFLSLACFSILAGLSGIFALWFGFMKKSISVTIVAAVIMATVLCQIMAALISFNPIIFVFVGVMVILTAIASNDLFHKVESAEV